MLKSDKINTQYWHDYLLSPKKKKTQQNQDNKTDQSNWTLQMHKPLHQLKNTTSKGDGENLLEPIKK
jgi:hypothetical protein